MLRTNLSTRPFYNERGVHIILGLLGLLVLALTIGNVVQLVRLSRQNTVLSGQTREDRAVAEELTRKARQTRQGINQNELKVIVAAAREANSLIDGRTFSWTALFNQLEATLPPDVMLASIRPTIDDGETRISMVVLARRSADADEFMEKLEATGAFDSVLPAQRDTTEEGLDRLLLQTVYTGVPPEESPAPVPAKTAPPAGHAPAPQQPAAKPATPAPQPSTPPPQPGGPARGGTGR